MSFITLYHHSLIQYLRFLCFKENAHKYCSCKLLKLFSLRKGGVSINVIIAISLEFGEMGTNMNLIQVMSKWSWIYFFLLRRCMLVCVIAAELWISSPECKLCWLKCSYWIFNIVIKVSFNLSFISTLINVYYACYNLYCQKCYRVFKRNFISTHKDTQFLMAVNGWERNERKNKKRCKQSITVL